MHCLESRIVFDISSNIRLLSGRYCRLLVITLDWASPSA